MLSGFAWEAYGTKCVFLMQPKVSYHRFDSTEGQKKGKGKQKGDENAFSQFNCERTSEVVLRKVCFQKYLMVTFSTEPQSNKRLFNLIFHSITPQNIEPSEGMSSQIAYHMSEIYYHTHWYYFTHFSVIF